MLPKNRAPTAPGEMLLEEFLKPRGVTQVELASQMGVPVQRVNTIVNGKRGITAQTAILLGEALDTTPEFWMGLQVDHDLWHALRKRAAAKGKGSDAQVRARRKAPRTSTTRAQQGRVVAARPQSDHRVPGPRKQ